MKRKIIEETVDTILNERKYIADKPSMMVCDKGDGNFKREGASLVKVSERWSDLLNRVRVTSIGIESAGNIT